MIKNLFSCELFVHSDRDLPKWLSRDQTIEYYITVFYVYGHIYASRKYDDVFAW